MGNGEEQTEDELRNGRWKPAFTERLFDLFVDNTLEPVGNMLKLNAVKNIMQSNTTAARVQLWHFGQFSNEVQVWGGLEVINQTVAEVCWEKSEHMFAIEVKPSVCHLHLFQWNKLSSSCITDAASTRAEL